MEGNSIVPSIEQMLILENLKKGNNICCRAVAGSGKTTSLLLCANDSQEKSCVILTYTKQLQLELNAKVYDYRLAKTRVYTYHSFASRLYGCTIHTDDRLRKALGRQIKDPVPIDIILLDEVQDMTSEYYFLVCTILKLNNEIQLVLTGDEKQSINEYKGSRVEFLTKCEELFPSTREWTTCKLSVSYRLTPCVAHFVNKHLYNYDYIIGGNDISDNIEPFYICYDDTYDSKSRLLFRAIRESLEKYGERNIFILLPSMNLATSEKSIISRLIRDELKDVNLYVQDKNGFIDYDIIKNKLAILTYHAAKGCERKCVILPYMDESYFTYYCQNYSKKIIPNILSVAATRATECLVLIASFCKTLRTIDIPSLPKDCTLLNQSKQPLSTSYDDTMSRNDTILGLTTPKTSCISVSEIIKNVHPTVIDSILKLVQLSILTPKCSSSISAPVFKIDFGYIYEDTSFVYGILATVLAELKLTGKSSFTVIATPAPQLDDFWRKINSIIDTPDLDRSLKDWAMLVIADKSKNEGKWHLCRQISNYDWLNEDVLISSRDIIIEELNGVSGVFEKIISEPSIIGRLDFYDCENNIVWEFKTSSTSTEEHLLQLICYICMCPLSSSGILYYLSDRVSDRKVKITINPDNKQEIMRLLKKDISYNPDISIYEHLKMTLYPTY